MLVHKWRSEEISIMAGTETILLDNPELNVREWTGSNPIRVIPDKKGRLFEGLKVMNGTSPTIIFSGVSNNYNMNQNYIHIPLENFEIPTLLKEMYNMNITSVFVEGGAKLIQSFINSGLWDESFVFFGNKMFSSGVKAPVIFCEPDEKIDFRGSYLFVYRNKAKKETLPL
jgi:diaminohydroxyphosphoribosylaminopyrimidine deaminase/5-amino-6-(5-phosphoribosylamino)uracil reductase